MACYLYGKRQADHHLWPARTKTRHPYEHACGPLCVRCGIPLGTLQSEAASERHAERTGHHIGTGACVEACNPEMTKPWWEIEPMNTAEAAELPTTKADD